MGRAVAATFLEDGWEVRTHLEGRGPSSRAAAAAAGLEVSPSLAAALDDADLVVSLVPPGAALEVARAVSEAAGAASRRPLYLDANSIAPATMAAVAHTVAAAGLECVDGTFVGSAADLGGRTRLYLSGPRAAELAAALPGALKASALGPRLGAASAFKLAFAGFNKGLVALFLEVMSAGEASGRPDELLASLRAFYPGTMETLERLLPSYPRHAARRADEIAELAGWLADEGRDAAWAEAARDALARFAALGLDGERRWTLEEALTARAARGGTEPASGDAARGTTGPRSDGER
jgi:3-hydroxyisobutyrate dehydrogenase-like beta-hydroxyacid dehydrogenase